MRKRRNSWEKPDLWDSPIAEELDLHGSTAAQARARVNNFVSRCSRTYSGQVVRIMTGKGRGSVNGPVLPPLVNGMLRGELQVFISEFSKDLDEAGFLLRLR